MNADRLIRWSTTIVVLTLAGIAAYVTYQHAYEVVRANGEGPATARLVPLTVDGLVYASSMVILYCARHRLKVPGLAWVLLTLGIAAVLAVNVAHGIAYGPGGALVGAWPAVALVGAYELLMWLVRSRADRAQSTSAHEPVSTGTSEEPAPVHDNHAELEHEPPETTMDDAEAARVDYRNSVTVGEPLSERALAARYGRSRNWARARIAEASRDDHPALHVV